MKRVTAFILALVLLLGILPFSGCAVKEDDALSMGQWLSYVADSFGMQSYTQDEPYFGKVERTIRFTPPSRWRLSGALLTRHRITHRIRR